jgi:aryl-alcohol dehydrogenase-like predicted oxidoreductase
VQSEQYSWRKAVAIYNLSVKNGEKIMKHRQLGQGGPMVGEVGFGAMSLAGTSGETDEATSHRTLDEATERGVSFIDTALIYGPFTSETVIGNYFRKNPSARQKFCVATKGGIVPQPRGVDNSAKYLTECVDGSLQRLGIDCVDLYYIHRRQFDLPIEDVMNTLLKFKAQGKIKAIGFSEISPASLMRASKVGHVAAVQSEYSLWCRLPELGMIQTCKKLGTAFVPFSPLARGTLSDVVIDVDKLQPADFRRTLPRFQEPNYSFNMAETEKFKAYARARGCKPASLALAWVLHQGNHLIPIPGTRTPDHLAINAAGAEINLTAQDLADIEEILPVGFAHGNRYSEAAQASVEIYS